MDVSSLVDGASITHPPTPDGSMSVSRANATPGLYPVRCGVCNNTRKELEDARERRIAEEKDGNFAASPRSIVHFDGKWLCTACGNPIVHHFDCVRTMQELDADRVKRLMRGPLSLAASVPSDDEGSIQQGSRPSSWKTPGLAATPQQGPSSLQSKTELPPLTNAQSAQPVPPPVDSNPFPRDPHFLVHVDGGTWVCSFPGCGQPIEVHRNVPLNETIRELLYNPPPDSNLSILAHYVGRVNAVSPRAASKAAASRPVSPGPSLPPPATVQPAVEAKHKMGLYAETCCVCGFPDYRPFTGYPHSKMNKQGVLQAPLVTMAHILAPDALEKVCYADDETNYLPMCGTLGWEGSCHDAFDKNLLLFAYEGTSRNDGHFIVWASDPMYRHLSGRHVVLKNKPHRSALHARARQALTSSQVVETPEMVSEAIVKMWRADLPSTDEGAPRTPVFDTEA